MQNFIPIIASVFGALLTCTTTHAHHNTDSVFDTEQEFVIEGVVEKLQWRNPHVYFSVTGTSDNGEENTWRIEAVGDPSRAEMAVLYASATLTMGCRNA